MCTQTTDLFFVPLVSTCWYILTNGTGFMVSRLRDFMAPEQCSILSMPEVMNYPFVNIEKQNDMNDNE